MPGMPYTVEVGAVLSALTDYFKEEKHQQDTLKDLRDVTKTLPDLLKSVGASDDIVNHFALDWLGYQSTNPMTKPADFLPANARKLGWWTDWYGNAEGTLRETMIRALEVALGIPHDGDEQKNSRCWRITFTWTCGAPMLQGWVYWWDFDANANGAGQPHDGIVNVIISTPGNGHPLYATPYRPDTLHPEDYDDNPAIAQGEYGLWVIGEDQMDVRLPGSHDFRGAGRGPIPDWPNFFHTSGNVVTVSPAEEDGGVKHAGDPFP